MLVGRAKDAARRWVHYEAVRLPGFRGAFFYGSATRLPDQSELPAASDLDLMVVHADPEPPEKPGKFVYHGVLLEGSYLSIDLLRSPEMILGNDHLVGSFRRPGMILDPSGRLTEVAADFAKRRWVERRCANAWDSVVRHARSLREGDPFHDQITAWLFATGVLTHVLLVAGLRNPSVRKRYVATRELLEDFGRSEFHAPLLELLGCAETTLARLEHHLDSLTAAFDAAKDVIQTPFFFASDISEVARPIAIDGSRELIARGLHREAVFWLVATYARCQKVLFHDGAPALFAEHDAGFRHLVGDLAITSFADLQRRTDRVVAFLPDVRKVAAEIIAANPEIEDG